VREQVLAGRAGCLREQLPQEYMARRQLLAATDVRSHASYGVCSQSRAAAGSAVARSRRSGCRARTLERAIRPTADSRGERCCSRPQPLRRQRSLRRALNARSSYDVRQLQLKAEAQREANKRKNVSLFDCCSVLLQEVSAGWASHPPGPIRAQSRRRPVMSQHKARCGVKAGALCDEASSPKQPQQPHASPPCMRISATPPELAALRTQAASPHFAQTASRQRQRRQKRAILAPLR